MVYAVHMMTTMQLAILVAFILGVTVVATVKSHLQVATVRDIPSAFDRRMERHQTSAGSRVEAKRRHRADQAGPLSISVPELLAIRELERQPLSRIDGIARG